MELLLADIPANPVYKWFTDTIAGWFTIVPWVFVLMVLMVLDFGTGLAKAWINKCVLSTEASDGVLRKAMKLAVVATGMMVEVLFSLAVSQLPENARPVADFVTQVPWGPFCAFLLSVTEIASIIENVSEAGVPVPKRLVDALAVINKHELLGKGPRITVKVESGQHSHVKVESDVKPAAPTQLTAEEQTVVDKVAERREQRASKDATEP